MYLVSREIFFSTLAFYFLSHEILKIEVQNSVKALKGKGKQIRKARISYDGRNKNSIHLFFMRMFTFFYDRKVESHPNDNEQE